VVAGLDPDGSSDRSRRHLKIRKWVVAGTAVGCRSLRHIVAADVAVGSCLLSDLGGCNQSHIAVLDGHVGIAGMPVRWYRSKTVPVRVRGLGHFHKMVAGNWAEVTAGNLAEANDHTPADRE
jgi:hypothetical protein